MSILIPIDGSSASLNAVRHAIALGAAAGAELHLLNVQPKIRGTASAFVGSDAIKAMHREEGMKVLQPALDLVAKAGLKAQFHIGVGDVGETVAGFVKSLSCRQVVMGTRGLGGVAGLVLGSAVSDIVEQVDVPVTLVK
ncbi:MAG: universal stress protein [Alphaproteobacteria bacterium]|nr:universal stress protein [Alphaproteobacteria bacterium]